MYQKQGMFRGGDFSNYTGLGVPRTIVIDGKGTIIYKNIGYSEEDIKILMTVIEKAVLE
jgi:hypothetical protein